LAELVTLEPLFQGKTENDQLFAIYSILGSPSARELDLLSKKVPFDIKLLRDLTPIPRNTKEIFYRMFHWVQDKANLIDLLEKMLAYLPDERITAAKALMHPYFDDVRREYLQLDLN
jgi:serine/threonine protein kinase